MCKIYCVLELLHLHVGFGILLLFYKKKIISDYNHSIQHLFRAKIFKNELLSPFRT